MDRFREINEKLAAYNKMNRQSKKGYNPYFRPRKTKTTYGKWLKKKLKSINLPQDELGHALGYASSTICNKIRLDVFSKMEKYYIKDILNGKIKSGITKSKYVVYHAL